MKKVLVAVALFASMVMASCGAPTADSIVDKINSCTTPEEVKEVVEKYSDDIKGMSTEDQTKVGQAAAAKTAEFVGGALNGLMGK